MRIQTLALAVALTLLIAAAASAVWWSARGGGAGSPRPHAAPPDGRGWVEGLGGLYGVARAESPNLGAIGYAPGSAPPRGTASGVTHFDAERAAPGVNLSTSGDRAEAELRALDGALLHTWALPYAAHKGLPPLEGEHQVPWRRVLLLDDGGLLAIHDGRALVRIDRESRPVWASPIRAHHDLALDRDPGRDGAVVHVLTRGERIIDAVNPRAPIVDDCVTTLDLDGNVLGELSLWDAFVNSEFAPMLDDLTVRVGDVMHSNTIEVLDGRLAARHPAFRAGNWLLCARDLDLVFVVDPRSKRIVWLTGGPWRAPHHPTATHRGTLLVFDNLGNAGDSRLVELEVSGGAVVSMWAPSDSSMFSTQFCGVATLLEGDNILVTESCRGRAFELAPNGDVVWEYVSPRRAGPEGRYVAALFEVERLERSHPGVSAALAR